jgi:Holliday junction resolvase RusA-like endonuclease
MTVIVLEPPAALINANQRLHHHAKAKLTKAWRDAARLGYRGIGGPHNKAHITCAIRFPTNHRRDVGNYYPTAKAILDGLVDAGVLPDDNDDHVTGPDMRRTRPNGPLQVTITIREIP